ncbi:MAG: hypothetical protein ACFFBP_21875 [Promethearchaeota archaeon]
MDSRKKTVIILWILVITVSIVLIVVDVLFFNMHWLIWIPISILIFLGCAVSFSQYFIESKKHCPRCNATLPSLYTKNCPKCGLKILTKCPDCGTFQNMYVGGKPIMYCNQCGLQLGIIKEEVEAIKNPYIQTVKVKFCSNCGVKLEEENPKFCSLCGGKIE